MFEFNEKTHTYKLDGKRMTGCTTVLGVIAKPALIGWASRMASEYVLENLKDINDLEEVCEKAKNAHTIKRDKAGDAGTDVHKLIEIIIKTAIELNNGIIMWSEKDAEAQNEKQVEHFVKWTIKNKVKFLESEKRVYSKKHFVAGTYDFKCEIDGKIYIGDIKTSSGIYDRTPFAQTSAYQMMEEEMTGKKDVQGRLIINLKKTGIFDEEKDVYVSEHYEDDLELFMSALSIYRIMKNRFEPINKFIK